MGTPSTFFSKLFLNLNEEHNPQMVDTITYYYNRDYKLLNYNADCAPASIHEGENPLFNNSTTSKYTLVGSEGNWESLYNYVIMVEIEVINAGKTSYINVIMDGIGTTGSNVNICFITNNDEQGNPAYYIKALGTLVENDFIIVRYSYSGKGYEISFGSGLVSTYTGTTTPAFPIPGVSTLGQNYHTTGVFIRQENEVGIGSSIMLYSNDCGIKTFNEDSYGDNLASALQSVHTSHTIENLQLTKDTSAQFPIFAWELADYIYLSYIVSTSTSSTLFTVRYTLDKDNRNITNISTMMFTNKESEMPHVISSVDMIKEYTISYKDSEGTEYDDFPETDFVSSKITLDTPISYNKAGANKNTLLYSIEYLPTWYNYVESTETTVSLVSIVAVF